VAYEYVFRGDVRPYAPSAHDQRAREQAKHEAHQLVNQEPVRSGNDFSDDVEVARKVADYQVGGLNAFGATSTAPSWEMPMR
jgi:hypothetical protein